ncbi:hypothetical protein PRNP1_007198 [Phytophthora ramorum]
MSTVTWRSSWSDDGSDPNVNVSSDGVSLPAPLQLTRPASDVPCELSLQWPAQPLRCRQLQIKIQSSARHVELHVDGTRRNLLGEEEQGQVYLGTFRGSKQPSDPLLFSMSPVFKQSDRDCDVLKSLQTLKVKFVSLTGDKSVLKLHEFRCILVPIEPVAAVDTRAAGLAAKMAALGMGGAPDAAPDVQMLLKGFQQTLEREMETKIARVIDAKLSTLSQRLAFSEQALFQLHKKMDAKDANVQASLEQIQHKFAQLETQLNEFSATKEKVNNVDDAEMKATEEEADTEAETAVPATEGE